ncbi:MAG: hypothetical protein WCF67_08805 [Chitinophagaceae bacterium]
MLDSLFGTGKLEKMLFNAYMKVTDPAAPPVLSVADTDKYQVQINPDSYSISHRIHYERNKPTGSPDSEAKYDHTSPTTLDFTILFDGTGVVPPPAGPLDNVPLVGAIASLFSDDEEFDVMKEIQKFMTVVYDYDGTFHEPRKVQLTWGRQIYDGVLASLSLNYKLFKADGTPLRVEAKVSFESFLTSVMKESKFKPSSPDLTHVRTIIAGDTLPLMANNIYGTPKYYIEVAKTNKLFNFRKLNEGKPVFFPPTKKTAS